MKLLRVLAAAWACVAAVEAQDLTKVESRMVDRVVRLPGEFEPFQQVDLHARVAGFIEKIDVDRATRVTAGQTVAVLAAPEMAARIAEAEARAAAVEAQRAEAEARLGAAQATYDRLKAASATPGVITQHEVVLAEKAVEGAKAVIRGIESQVAAMRAAIAPLREMEKYLKVTAPFAGTVTERMAHTGALVGPERQAPLVRIEQLDRLRLTVAVPEYDAAAIPRGGRVAFTVPAHAGETFHGTVARIAGAMDPKTRTMAVELDVANPRGALAPGMFADVQWPVRKPRPSLLVPPTAIVTTTERVFVIRAEQGKAVWVNVRRAGPVGDLVEVLGPLTAGDMIVKRASDEIREGTALGGGK